MKEDRFFVDFFWMGRMGRMGQNPPAQLLPNLPAELFEKILLPNCFKTAPFLPLFLFDRWLQIIPSIIPSGFFYSIYHFFQIYQISCGLYHFFSNLPCFWMVVFSHGLPRKLFTMIRTPTQLKQSILRIFQIQCLHNFGNLILWICLLHNFSNWNLHGFRRPVPMT